MSAPESKSSRAEGPDLVEQGPEDADVLFVLDPAGLGRHGDLPASWRGIARSTHIAWLRLPAAEAAMPRARDVLERLAEGGGAIDLVAEGAAAEPAMLLATESFAGGEPRTVRSVLLVDPEPRSRPIEQVLIGHGVRVKVLDRGATRVPLGHPRVVAEVAGELHGRRMPARPRRTSRRPSVAGQVWQAVRMRIRDRFTRPR
ncbi:hypothetical protein [Crossiella cryophila]|uniref:Uncharacterized protein n=1 Tax=Crossiella cryophila TaxID=43355 RepID=A0A7W7C453_9PSEU|nr:hypothetical protein [Crossiella cryophila]MBB4674144.1 hypothetical protein [Crossiella cryophila]